MTAKTKTQRFRRLISHGFFAPELPPCFVAHDFARYRESIWSAIEAVLPSRRNGPQGSRQFISEPCWFYFPRYGRDDRKHGIINPVSYLAIARTVADNFVKLRSVAKQSQLSTSPLVFDWNGNRAIFRPSVDLRDDFRIDLSTRRERFATADIRAFFHSIYTHAIPWAIYGKTWAKQNRSNSHYGNLLDLYCRNAQDGQTIGLPVGPDTSRLIAEVVASAVDMELRQKIDVTSRDTSRYVDDYTIGVDHGQSGDGIIAAVRQAAAKFELELNNDKSAVLSTSHRSAIGWKQTALAHIPRTDRSTVAFLRFFYEIGRVCNEHPEINVEKYAFQNARSSFVQADDWQAIQNHLINAYRRNPSLISFLVEVLVLRQVEHQDVNHDSIRSFLERRLPELSAENRTGEIAWLLFLLIRLEIEIPSDVLSPLYGLENALVALLVTYASAHGHIVGNIDHSTWEGSLASEGLHGQMWLYAYESVRQGVSPNGNADFIEQNPFFAPIYAKRVSFFSPATGFTSVSSTLRERRGENARARLLRADFLADLEIDLDEFDSDDFDDDHDEEFFEIYD